MTDQHQGWAGEDAAARAWDVFGDSFAAPLIVGAEPRQFAGRTFRAWDAVPDHTTFPQLSNDCVSVSTCDVLDMMAQIEIALGDAEEFHRLYPPFLYATSRVLIGQNQLKGRGGSVGSWMAKALETYGALRADVAGVPAYSGRTADDWGDGRGDWKKWLPEAKPHTVSATFLGDWNELVEHICRGYLCTMASSLGFIETPDNKGFHHQSGTWNHSMGIWGISDDARTPWVGLHNNWGDCFSSDTEVLTKRGWIRFEDAVALDEMATLNTKTWELEYQFPSRLISRPSGGAMVHCHGRDVDLLVTPGHRMFQCNHGKDKQVISNWRFIKAEDLGRTFYIKKNAEVWNGEEVQYVSVAGEEILADDWFEFMGYYLSEGCTFVAYRENYSESVQNRGLKIANAKRQKVITTSISQVKHLSKFARCLSRLPFRFARRGMQWHCVNQGLGRYLLQFGKSGDVFVPPDIKNASRRLLRIFFDAAMLGDGTDTGASCVYYSGSKQMADDMQEVILKCGYASDIVVVNRVGQKNNQGRTYRLLEYRVGIKKKQLMQRISKHSSELVGYSGMVHCATVPNGTLYVRRNGKAAWCGNCHGHLIDFETNEPWPTGMLRVRPDDIERAFTHGEVIAYSNFNGFADRDMPSKWET